MENDTLAADQRKEIVSQQQDHAGDKSRTPLPVIDAKQRIKDLITDRGWEAVRGIATCIVMATSEEDREDVMRVMFEMLVSPNMANLKPLGDEPDPSAPPAQNVIVRFF